MDALNRARTLWQQLGSALPEAERRRNRFRHRTSALGRIVPIAAALVFGIHFGYNYWTIGRFDEVTAIGERRSVSLPDGSRIVMSGDTALNLVAAQGVRRIDLARGEIFVQARHDPINPLVVHAGNTQFRDVGTVFDVSRTGVGERLVVLEGLVEASRDDRRLLVGRNEGVSATRSLGAVRAADAKTETAWIGGRLVFRDKTLPQILTALAPYSRTRIVLLRSGGEGALLSATIDLGHVDEWLAALEQMQGLRAIQIAGYTFLS